MSADTRFNCNFLDLKTESSPKPELYKDYFVNYNPSKWKVGSGGGSFKYFDGKGVEYSLTISEDSRYGIILSYERWDDQENKSIGSWYSVGNESDLSQMIENEDQLLMPVGAYIKPKEAWLAVNDFLANPTKISEEIQWINVDDIHWPEE